MYNIFLYADLIILGGIALSKANKHKSEWILILLIMSFVKTCITFLFAATTVFTVVTIGGFQVHLDDIILLICLVFLVMYFIKRGIPKDFYMGISLMITIPIIISLFRGCVNGDIGSADFLSDIRKYFVFAVVLVSFYIVFNNLYTVNLDFKCKYYIDTLMNVVIVYVLCVWFLDSVLGVNSLPGQVVGTLSDGGSTFRIINPPQTLMIAFYALWKIYEDLKEQKFLKIRTLVLILIVLFLQWRTVVAAFLIGVVLIFILKLKEGIFSVKLIGEILGVLVALGLIAALTDASYYTDMMSNLFGSYSNVASGTGTFSTRTMVWSMLIGTLRGVDKWIGHPFGSSLNIEWTASAHSGYVDYLMVTGYIGTSLLVIMCVALIILCIRKKLAVFAIILISLMVYWYGYGFSIEQAALIGYIMAFLHRGQSFDKIEGSL